MFTSEQLKGFARWLLTLVGGLVAGWFASKGWFTADQVMSVFNSPVVLGLVVSGVSLVWNLISKTVPGLAAAAQSQDSLQVVSSDPKVVEAVPGVISAR